MRQCLFCVLLLVAMSSGTRAACVDPSTLVRSTVNISREFDEEEQRAEPGVLGIRGTAWFLSPRLVVTAAHVADAMHLSAQDWKDIGIQERASRASLPARILRVAGTHQEKIAVLELSRPFPGATVLRNRMGPLVPDEPLASLAYPGSELRFAGGRFVEYGDDAKFAGMALLEMFDGNDRLVLDHGASGAPILDCEGRVVAVVSTLITQTISFASSPVRVSTAWQMPNVVSIPIDVLKDFSWPD
jgi:Trypsin-like peptidase domain